MTDPTDPTNPSGPAYPPSPPTAPDPTAPLPSPVGQWQAPAGDVAELQTVRSGGSSRKVLAIGAAALVLGAGAYATTQLFGDDRGAGSPEEAGRRFLEAVNDEDLLGVIDLLPAGEQQLLLDITDELTSESQRLGLVDDGFRLDGIPGLSIDVADPELEVEELSEGLALVTLVGGEASFEVDGDELAGSSGEVLDGLADAAGQDVEIPDAEGDADIEELIDEAEESGAPGNPFMVAVVEEDGRWFPSLGFTIAEFARLDSGADAPELTDGIAAEGAADPEGAVQALLDAATGADAADAIAVLDPGELGALQVYSDTLLGDLPTGEDTGVEVELTDAEVTSLGGGVNRVVPTGIVAEGEIDGSEFSFELADGCITATTESDDDDVEDLDIEACAGDDPAEVIPGELGEAFEDLEVPDELTELVEAFEPIEVGIITVERGGEHFVSPIRTLFDLQGAFYRGLERRDLEEGGIVFQLVAGELDEEFEDFFDELGDAFAEQFAGFEEDLEVIDEPILDDEFELDDDLFEEDPFDDEVPLRTPTGASGPNGELRRGDVVEGSLPAGGEARFTVLGSAGDAFIGAQGLNGEDLTIEVLDADGVTLEFNDDFNGFDPEAFLTLAEGQVVTVVVRDFGDTDAAEFVVYYE